MLRRATTEGNMKGAAALVRRGNVGGEGGAADKLVKSAKTTKVTLSWCDEAGDHSVDLPVLRPASELGNPVIDVRTLAAKTGKNTAESGARLAIRRVCGATHNGTRVSSSAGFFTHDPGFTSTSSCESAISYIDGEKGLLMHRGYPIEDLAMNCNFPGDTLPSRVHVLVVQCAVHCTMTSATSH